jgi:hypothetical protein
MDRKLEAHVMAAIVMTPPTLVRVVRLDCQREEEKGQKSDTLGFQAFVQKPDKRQESVNEKK